MVTNLLQMVSGNRLPFTLLGLMAVAIGGCGAQRTDVISGHDTSTARVVTDTVTHTIVRATATGAGTRPVPSASVACTTSELAVRFLGENGATGSVVLVVALRNESSTRCHTFGFPGVQFRSRAGAPLPTRTTRTTHDALGPSPERLITLAPGQEASFRLLARDEGAGGTNKGCTVAHGLGVIAPDDTVALVVKIPQGAAECGQASVSPLEPGTDAEAGT